jgi:thiosulfate dehydrogenase (quinone) large subunit
MTLSRSRTVETDYQDVGPAAGAAGLGATALALLRISLGVVFLWAFLDKTFGWNYSTPSAKAWVNGGSPTKGFLASVDVGPFQSWFHSIAGTWWADWMFMLGLLGIGVALILGIGVRLAAIAGVIMMAFMWLAEFPPAQHTSAGKASGSTHPFADYHFIYAVALIAVGATAAYSGAALGLGWAWSRLAVVRKNPWLR